MNKITIIGSGLMGHGIGQLYATYGKNVVMYDIEEKSLVVCEKMIEDSLIVMVEQDIITSEHKKETLGRLTYTTDLNSALFDADMVVEVIPEILELKHEMYKKIEAVVSKDTIITSNTSSIPLTELVEHAQYPDRFFITHFFAPAQLIPLVEIVKTDSSRPDLLATIETFLNECQKSPIILKKEVPGFIANRIQMAILRECFWLIENDVASASDIDTVMKDSLGFRYAFLGPLEGQDIAGLKTPYFVTSKLFPEISDAKTPPQFFKDMVDNNVLGIRTGEGFYKYSGNDVEEKLKTRDQNFLDIYKLKAAKK